jgi:hypothetical protein
MNNQSPTLLAGNDRAVKYIRHSCVNLTHLWIIVLVSLGHVVSKVTGSSPHSVKFHAAAQFRIHESWRTFYQRINVSLLFVKQVQTRESVIGTWQTAGLKNSSNIQHSSIYTPRNSPQISLKFYRGLRRMCAFRFNDINYLSSNTNSGVQKKLKNSRPTISLLPTNFSSNKLNKKNYFFLKQAYLTAL